MRQHWHDSKCVRRCKAKGTFVAAPVTIGRGLSHKALYEMRDRSGLTRQQFYLQNFGELGPEDAILEVGDVPLTESGS
jgi:hypothetical protein